MQSNLEPWIALNANQYFLQYCSHCCLTSVWRGKPINFLVFEFSNHNSAIRHLEIYKMKLCNWHLKKIWKYVRILLKINVLICVFILFFQKYFLSNANCTISLIDCESRNSGSKIKKFIDDVKQQLTPWQPNEDIKNTFFILYKDSCKRLRGIPKDFSWIKMEKIHKKT